jgi:succinoglycan biosynthesis transport protein ExoP
MDTIDRSGSSNLPSPFRAVPTPLPVLPPGHSGELATASTHQVNPKTLLRGLTRHWWQILLIWLVLSLPAMYLIHQLVQPTFEAASVLRVTPTSWQLYEPSRSDQVDFRGATPYLQTQIGLITSDRVLGPAINSTEVVNLSTIRNSDDPREYLREHMLVEIVKDAYLIRVALELPDRNQAAAIVNAVVHSYLLYNGEHQRGGNSTLRKCLAQHRDEFQKQINEKREELRNIYKKGNVGPGKQPRVRSKTAGDDPDGDIAASEEQSERLAQQMLDTELEIIKVDSDLKTKEEAKQLSEEEQRQLAAAGDKQREQLIQDEFKKDPDVMALCEDIALADEQREHARKVARKANDPARQVAEQKYKDLRLQYNELWEKKFLEISERLKTAVISPHESESIEDLKRKLASLKTQRAKQTELFNRLKIEKKIVDNDSFDASFASRQLDIVMHREQKVDDQLKQLEFEASQENVRVTLLDPAVAPTGPTNNKRFKYMAAAPVALLFMILSLFCLLEVRAERVADPDMLSTRVRSEVYALPPLPTTRAIRKLSEPEAADQIEQFIQRLDHLRFAVCGSPTELGKGRCVLITSAIGGEGKTTLAAQLAARCGNAGMSTLLIDADLRRAALCTLLDVPEGPGLSDVLKEEATTDEVVIPVQGGTFYLLPAGTPIQDTNRLFQGRNLGLLITQLRQLYDLIIIDSPPVLPVPDALIIGRWVDGVVLAARYDISRFPQVERARRQIDNAGIPIMGTVINGMRNADSYYGRYCYSRRRSPQPDSTETI